MHTVVDPGPVPTPGELVEFLTVIFGPPHYEVMASALLARGHTGAATRNYRGFQPPETEVQRVAGDGRRILSERVIDIIIEGASILDAHRKLTNLEENLGFAAAIRYAGMTQVVRAWRGVTSTQPIGGGRSLRVSLAYFPVRAYAVDANDEPVLGVV